MNDDRAAVPADTPAPDTAALARLAALRPDADDAAALAGRLRRLLRAVAVLHAADLDGVPPTHRQESPQAAPREDRPEPWAGPPVLPAGTPRTPDGSVAVPAPRRGEDPA